MKIEILETLRIQGKTKEIVLRKMFGRNIDIVFHRLIQKKLIKQTKKGNRLYLELSPSGYRYLREFPSFYHHPMATLSIYLAKRKPLGFDEYEI